VLYRICGTARVDRESVDASLKGSTGERSGLLYYIFSGISLLS
jgi:hypothetical protein